MTCKCIKYPQIEKLAEKLISFIATGFLCEKLQFPRLSIKYFEVLKVGLLNCRNLLPNTDSSTYELRRRVCSVMSQSLIVSMCIVVRLNGRQLARDYEQSFGRMDAPRRETVQPRIPTEADRQDRRQMRRGKH